MDSYLIQARIGENFKVLGKLESQTRHSSFELIRQTIHATLNLNSIELISAFKGTVIGLAVSQDNPQQVDGFPLVGNEVDSPEKLKFVTSKIFGAPCYSVVGVNPLQVKDPIGSKNSLGLIFPHRFAYSHDVHLIMGFEKAIPLDSQKISFLFSIASIISASGFNLLQQICCLDPMCSNLGLSPLNHFSRSSISRPRKELLASSEERLLTTFSSLEYIEQMILELMAEGKSNSEISKELFVSTSFVRNSSSTIYNKIGARNRQDAVVLWTKHQHLRNRPKIFEQI